MITTQYLEEGGRYRIKYRSPILQRSILMIGDYVRHMESPRYGTCVVIRDRSDRLRFVAEEWIEDIDVFTE